MLRVFLSTRSANPKKVSPFTVPGLGCGSVIINTKALHLFLSLSLE